MEIIKNKEIEVKKVILLRKNKSFRLKNCRKNGGKDSTGPSLSRYSRWRPIFESILSFTAQYLGNEYGDPHFLFLILIKN